MTMKLGWIPLAVSALMASLVAAGGAQAALWCSQEDGHGNCLVCDFDDANFTLAPGEAKQPLACANMAADTHVSIVYGGTGTVIGTPPDSGLRSVIGLSVGGEHRSFRRYSRYGGWSRHWGYGYGHRWGPNTPTMPVGPTTTWIGRARLGGTVAPVFSLTACRSGDGYPHACDFTLSGRICVRGLC